jgi:hypothetical protein
MQPVSREDLVINKMYYIETLTEDENKNYVTNKKFSLMVGIFKGPKKIIPYVVDPWNAMVFDWFDISKMKEIKNETDSYKHIIREVELNYLWRFYEVKKFKIQNDMEMRAVNLCLKNIIGDPYFMY